MNELAADDDETQAPPRRSGGDRRGWLYGTGVAVVVVIGLIAFLASRGDGGGAGHGGMPGMDMSRMDMDSGGDRVGELPEMVMSGVSRMGELVMPPGMVMTPGMTMEAAREMAAVDPADVDADAPDDARGDQPLQPRIVDGVKELELRASV
ncbi:MAG: hypothetical protein ACLGI3_16460, partial [Actinomycetes bacterium]